MNSEQPETGTDIEQQSKDSSPHRTRRIKRRHVILAVMMMIGCIAAAWYQYVRYRDFLPVEDKRPFAVFRFEKPQSRTSGPLRDTDDKERHGRAIKGHFVLAQALRRQPEVAQSSLLEQEPYPVEWLIDHTEIDFPADNQLRVSLRTPRTKESVVIVNAIIDSYWDEVVNSDSKGRRMRREKLSEILQKLGAKLRLKENAALKLAEALNAVDPKLRPLKQQLAIEKLGLLKRHHREIQFELVRARIELKLYQLPAADVDDIEIPEAIIDYKLTLEPAILTLRSELQRLEKDMSSPDAPDRNKLQPQLDYTRASLELKESELRPNVRQQLRRSLLIRGDASNDELQRRIELLEIEDERLREEIESQAKHSGKVRPDLFELTSLKRDIVELKKKIGSLKGEIERLDGQLSAKPRITILRRAEL